MLTYISIEKFEPEPVIELGPPDIYSGALTLSYPGFYSNSPSNSPLEMPLFTRLYEP